MLRVGLTGGLGSGKSTVAGYLRELGAEVIEADELGRALMEPGQKVFTQIVRLFGIRDSRLFRSTQDQQSSLRIAFELGQTNRVPANNGQDLIRGAIACLQQNHLGRRASRKAEAGEVFVLGQKGESMCLRIFPDKSIGHAAKSNRVDVY
jgi:ABC-type glutathione transport system ATPase component